MEKVPISVVVITKNEENNIAECLKSAAFADEVIVLDDNSTDRTVEIARSYTDRIFQRKMDIEGVHRNYAYSQAKNKWVLSLDADELVSPELKEEIARVVAGDTGSERSDSEGTGHVVFAIPLRNYIGGYWVRWGGWARCWAKRA